MEPPSDGVSKSHHHDGPEAAERRLRDYGHDRPSDQADLQTGVPEDALRSPARAGSRLERGGA